MNNLQNFIEEASGIVADGHAFGEIAEPQAVEAIGKLLEQRRFAMGSKPRPLRPVFSLIGQPIATPGNLATITAPPKNGKTAVIGAMIASALPVYVTADLLGFESSNPQNRAIIHIDSEQSPDDHYHLVCRLLKRIKLTEPPPWLCSYCLTGGLGSQTSLGCLKEAVRVAYENHGGIHSIFIDGVADMVANVNDPEESNSFVAELHALAILYDCPIICVIHFNPGGEKTRGHLGSQLERKAETNLRLDKNEETITIWSEKQRRAPIPKHNGLCFAWNADEEMHVSVKNPLISKESDEKESLSIVAQDIFKEKQEIRYTDMVTILTGAKIHKKTAERRIKRMCDLGIIQKVGTGLYTIGATATSPQPAATLNAGL